ncbi:MAG: hypothetical protein QG604_944 [Candidatus Dependentiae bacterium]|nr:hypothetical protein [Candidatus Dependentiae bacterium]
MKKNILLITLACTISTSMAVLEYGGKTYFALPHFDINRCQETALWHTHTTTDVGNPLGLSLQIIPFVNKAVRTDAIAKQLTYKESATIPIAGDRFNQASDSVLPYHAIVHNPVLSPPEASATLTLNPDFSNIGATFSAFFDAKASCPGVAFQFHMPLYYTTASLIESGGTRTIEQYFSGTYSQTSPIQDALTNGLLGKHRHTVCGPLSITMRYSLIENDNNYLTVYAGAGITLKKKPVQTYLFDYHSTAYDHHKFICGLEAGATVAHFDEVSVEIIAQTNYHYMFGGSENRIMGLLDDDGSIPLFSPYLLGAQNTVAGVFPLANVLHQSVQRSGIHQADIAFITAITWQSLTINLGYELFGRQAERLTLIAWPENTYAIVSPMYATSAPFTNALSTGTFETETILLNHRFLTSDMINTNAGASPAQLGCAVTIGAGYNTKLYGFPIGFGAGMSFENGFNNATASMIGGWIKGLISF